LRREVRNLIEMVGKLMNMQEKQLAEPRQSVAGTTGNLPPVDTGENRDPAYLLRARVWDRLRSGVLIT